MAVTFTFSLDDLAHTRFAISPMWEAIMSLRRLRQPETATMHLPWVREALPRAARLDLRLLFALSPVEGYIPDFLTPPPTTPVASFADELEALRATPHESVRAEVLESVASQELREPPPLLAAMLEDPQRALDGLAATLAEYWRLVLADHWPRIRALLDGDLHHRAHQLTTGGPARLFADLHDRVTWEDARLVLDGQHEQAMELAGRGLLLVPSVFIWHKPMAIMSETWQPTVLYPARGVELLWDTGAPRSEALAGVVGRTRATLLEMLEAPRSTTELAARLELSAGGVSMHLTALRDAGLVSSARRGRTVLYARTPVAEGLVAASGG